MYEGEKRLKLDVGCGANKQPGFIGMDARALDGVDIVQDVEKFPWPLEDECCVSIIASHLIEHIKPWFSIAFLDECWRLLEVGGQIALACPYPGSRGFWQDPTHCNGWSEVTFQYFDPHYPLYSIYQPKPWSILKGYPSYQVTGNLEVIMTKLDNSEGEYKDPKTLAVTVADAVDTTETIGG